MIDNISISDTGFIRIDFTHDDDYTTQLHIPTNVTINTGSTEGDGTQKVVVTYGDGVTKEIGNPLNYIIKTACNKDTGWHLYVLYSDPVKRNAGPKVTYEGRADWTDLGYIGNGELGAIAAKESDTAAQALIRELPPYSAWLIIEE